MRFLGALISCLTLVSAEIWQNQQLRSNPYPGQATLLDLSTASAQAAWKVYPANASEINYKGRWDSKHISWWSAPGLKVAYSGSNLALTFGNYTDAGVLLAWRIDGQDWQFANVTANATYQFVDASTTGQNLTNTTIGQQQTFEFRVTNWAYGVQVESILVSSGSCLYPTQNSPLMLEVIGDSLSAGQYATYEGISSYSWGLGEGFGDIEFSITAYPGICLHDARCYGNLRGQAYQWLQTSDTSGRAIEIWGDNPEPWDFAAHQPADIVVINLGTNDANPVNNVTSPEFTAAYIQLIEEVHSKYPHAQIILLSLWEGFSAVGNTYIQGGAFIEEIQDVVAYFQNGPQHYVHYYNTTGILQHNDIGPQYHPTDVGHVKIASHLMEYIRIKFGWVLGATGPEVQSMTLYWNDQQDY